MLFKLSVVIAVCFAQAFLADAGVPCPCGWKKIFNGCYRFVRSRVTWDAARASCQIQGGDLALPLNYAECHYLTLEARKNHLSVPWIGLFRRYDSAFVTTCGKKVRYTRWAPGEPNHVNRRENCGHMYSNGARAAKWNDIPCNHKWGYICEYKVHRCD